MGWMVSSMRRTTTTGCAACARPPQRTSSRSNARRTARRGFMAVGPGGAGVGGERLLQGAGVGVVGFYLQRVDDVFARCGQVVLCAIETRQREPGRGTGTQLDGGLGLGACLRVVAIAPADFGEAGMGVGVIGIGGESELEFALRLQHETSAQVGVAAFREGGGLLRRRQGSGMLWRALFLL